MNETITQEKANSSSNLQSTNTKVSEHSTNVGSIRDEVEKSIIPLSLKGSFFQDSFFDNCRFDFMSSLNKIIAESQALVNDSKLARDIYNSYRNIRVNTPKEDNQASAISETETSYKVSTYEA